VTEDGCGGVEEGRFCRYGFACTPACGSVEALRAGCFPRASPQAGILSRLQRLDCPAGRGVVGSLHPHPEHDDETVMIGAPVVCGYDRATRLFHGPTEVGPS
jgi:hypothetical protein